jgi:two-component system sensor histidine kinase DegS
MNGLRPELLEIHGFVGATKEYLKSFGVRNNIKCTFDCNLTEFEVNKQYSLAFYRILQEATNNIAKHAQATKLNISLKLENNKLIMEVSDNGVGFEQSNIIRKDAYGMIGMNERITLLNGTMKIESKLGKGTKLKVEMPYN